MDNIVRFEKESIGIPSGSTIRAINVLPNGELHNKQILPGITEINAEYQNMIDYQKRYTVAQGVDMAMKKIAEEGLQDKPVVIVIHPQSVSIDKPTGNNVMNTTMEIGIVETLQATSDIELNRILD